MKFLANRIKSSDYRGLHLSQHNRYDQNKIKTIIQAIFNEVGGDFLQIRTTDMSKRPSNIIGEEVYAKVVDSICKFEMSHNSGKKNQVTQDSLRKNLFVDMHRMGLIERYNKNKEPTNPYIQSNIKYVSLTPLAIEFLNVQDLLRKNFCYTQALENLLKGFGAECREVMIELDNHYLDIEEMMFFVTFLNIANFTRSEIIEYVREYRSLSRIQKEKLKELVQDYCNPNHFNGNKLEKRDYHIVDMHRMGLIERYNKNKEPTNPYIQSNIKYVSLTPLAIEFLNVQDLLRKNFCYTQALENLLKGFGAECREVMIELDNHYLDIEEMMFFVTFLNIANFTRSEIIEYVREYRSLSRIQKEKLKELAQDYCNPNHFNGNKLEKRDYHNWKNQAQQIFSLLEQSVFF